MNTNLQNNIRSLLKFSVLTMIIPTYILIRPSGGKRNE